MGCIISTVKTKDSPLPINRIVPSLPKSHSSSSPSGRKHSFRKEETTTSFTDIRKIYKFDPKIIGSGHFGTVRLASLFTNPTKKFAVKTIFKEKVKKDLHLLRRELEILKTLDHPNIVKFYEVYQDEKFFHLVMEYCSGGELLKRIMDQKQLKEQEAASIMKKIFSATKYLHERGICHRDLKPENFLFSQKGKGAEIKIIDFGLSKQYDVANSEADQAFRELKTVVGTALYVAPEVLKGKYDYRCDNWSLGVVTYVLLSGNPPFFGSNNKEIFAKVMKGKYFFTGPEWKNVSKKAKDFISKLICVDVNKRMSSEQALSHSFLNNIQLTEHEEVIKVIEPKIINMIKNFRGSSILKKEVMRVIVNNLTENEIKNLREAFRLIDKDNSGMISIEELKKVMQDLGHYHYEEDLQGIMQTFNEETGEEEINYSEFIAAILDKKVYLNREKLYTVFKHFDIDNSNFITKENLKEVMARGGRKITTEALENWLNEIDLKKNGKLSFEEFYEMMKNEEIHEIKMDDIQEESKEDM